VSRSWARPDQTACCRRRARSLSASTSAIRFWGRVEMNQLSCSSKTASWRLGSSPARNVARSIGSISRSAGALLIPAAAVAVQARSLLREEGAFKTQDGPTGASRIWSCHQASNEACCPLAQFSSLDASSVLFDLGLFGIRKPLKNLEYYRTFFCQIELEPK
jgi:hypothetical protein